MMAAAELLSQAAKAVLSWEAALVNTAAVARLASAITSLVKRAVQFTKAAAGTMAQQAAAVSPGAEAPAGSWFVAVVPGIIDVVFEPSARMLLAYIVQLAEAKCQSISAAGSSSSGNTTTNSSSASSSSSRQAAASTAFLAVVLARSLVQLADAMEAAGPELLFRSLTNRPCFDAASSRQLDAAAAATEAEADSLWARQADKEGSSAEQRRVDEQWSIWQELLLQACLCLHSSLDLLRLLQREKAEERSTAAPAAAPAGREEPAAAAAAAVTSGARSSRSSSSDPPVTWSYLLQLQHRNPTWSDAVAAFAAQQQQQEGASASEDAAAICGSMQQQCQDALKMCRAVAAAAPLPGL
jgi:hypothetical protein